MFKRQNVFIGALQSLASLFVIIPALFMPYKMRMMYFRFVGSFVHLPYIAIGSLSNFLMKQLNIEFQRDEHG